MGGPLGSESRHQTRARPPVKQDALHERRMEVPVTVLGAEAPPKLEVLRREAELGQEALARP
eukprot:10300304-Alexandrium_andersonii.AAC.1